ncbi:uncharacterized protein [Branchiostoma lanceolatum]|uniref:uncharacterized protein isoform X2 n=1 Tax=Branchiostoma lanceolatum TaxID=7740 RepID=UPI003455989F
MGVLTIIFDAVILLRSYLEYVVIFAMGAYISYFLAYFFSTAKAVRDQAAAAAASPREQGGRATTSEEQKGADDGGTTTRRRRNRRSGRKMGNKNATELKSPVESVSLHGMSDTSLREHDKDTDDVLAINTDIIPSKDDGEQADLENTGTNLQDSCKVDLKDVERPKSKDTTGQTEEGGVTETGDPNRSVPGMADGETAVGKDGGVGDKGESTGGNSGVRNAADEVCADHISIKAGSSASASSEKVATQENSKEIYSSQSLGSATSSIQADTCLSLKAKPRGGRRKGRRQRTNNKSAIGVTHAKHNTIIDATGKGGAVNDCKQLGRKDELLLVCSESLEQPDVKELSASCRNLDKIKADSSAKVYDPNNSKGRSDNGQVKGLSAPAEFESRKTGETDDTDSVIEPVDVRGQKLNTPKPSADPEFSCETLSQGSTSMEIVRTAAEAGSCGAVDDVKQKLGAKDEESDAGGDTVFVRRLSMKSEDNRCTKEHTGCGQSVWENEGVNDNQTKTDEIDTLSCEDGKKRTSDQITEEVSLVQEVSLESACKDVDSRRSGKLEEDHEGTPFPVTALDGHTGRTGGRDSGCDVDVGDADVTLVPGKRDADAESCDDRCVSADNTTRCPESRSPVGHKTDNDNIVGNVSETEVTTEVGSPSSVDDEQGRPTRDRDSGVDFGLDDSRVDAADGSTSPGEIDNKAFKMSKDAEVDHPTLSTNQAGCDDTESLTKNSRWVLRNTFLTIRSKRNIKTKQTTDLKSVSPNVETENGASPAPMSSIGPHQNSSSEEKTAGATNSKVTARKIKLTLDQALCPPQLNSNTSIVKPNVDKDSLNSSDKHEKTTDEEDSTRKENEADQLFNDKNQSDDDKEVEDEEVGSSEDPAGDSIAYNGTDQILNVENKNSDENVRGNGNAEPSESITVESIAHNGANQFNVENKSTEEKVTGNDTKAESSEGTTTDSERPENGSEQFLNVENSNAKKKPTENATIGTDDVSTTCVGNVSRSPVESSRAVVDPTPGGSIHQFTQRNSTSLSAGTSDNQPSAQLPLSCPGTSGYWSDPGADCGSASPLEFSVDPAPFLDDTFAGMMPLYPRGQQQRQPADSLRRRSLRSSTSVEAALRYYDAPERSRTPPPHSMYKPSAYYRRSMIDLREGYVPPSTRTEARRRETKPKEVVKTEVKSAEIKRETPVLKQVLLASTTPPLRRRSAEDLTKEKEKLEAKIAAKHQPTVTKGETQEKIHATKVIVEDVEPVEVEEKPVEKLAEVTEIEIEPPLTDIKDRPPSPSPPPTVAQPPQKPDTIPTDTTPPPKIEEKTATIEQEHHETTTTTEDPEPQAKEEPKELPRRSVVYTAMEALESELLCPVCLDHFKSPLLLPCLHSVCSKCAEGILVHPNGDPMSKIGAASDYRDEPRSSLKCPSCRHEIILDGRGLDGLKRNLILENIIERYKQATSVSNFPGGGKKVVPCDVCRSDPPKPAVKSCVKCELSYCETCLKLTHPTTRTGKTAFADHKFVVPTVDPQTKVLMCTEHREEKVNLFCVTDDTPVCSLCKLVGRHKEHEVKPLEITYNEQKEKLAKDVQELVGINTEMVHYIAKLRSLCEMVEQNFSKMEASVKDEFSRLRMIVDEREKAMVGKLHDEKERRVEDRKQQVAVYRKTLEGTTAAVTYAQEALKEPNEGCFLQTSKAIRKRVRMAVDSAPSLQSSTELVDQLQLKHFQIDFSNLVPMLGQLDFLKLPSTPEFLTDQCYAEESSVYLRWHCKDVSAFDTYQVQYARSYASSAIVSSIYKTISDISDVRRTISGLQPDTQYTFFVRAVNKAGQTPRSEGLKIRTKTAAFKFTLDPDTAHPDLDISDDGCSVTYDSAGSSRRNVPTRPERFTDYVAVLGNAVVSQGRHYWEIDVSRSRGYRIGVAYRSTPRNEYIGSNNSSWAIQCHNKRFALWHQNKSQTIQLSSPPSKIGILVDFSSGTLTCITMSQPGNKQQIYSFQTKFRESLCPAFAVWDNCLTVISGLPTPTI